MRENRMVGLMHEAAYEWVHRFATTEPVDVLDIGGRDINGTVRPLFPNATSYVAVDLHPGVGVDVVADVVDWRSELRFDVIVCCEVLEHSANWREIVDAAHTRLRPGGRFIMTCAGPGRPPHSGVDGEWQLHPGEHYGNVSPSDLEEALSLSDWSWFTIDQHGEDVRCVAIKW